MIFLYRDPKEIVDQHSSRVFFLALIATLFSILPLRNVWASDSEVSFCFNDWPPYATKSADGVAGISVNIVQQAAQRIGIQVNFEELPWNRCLQKVKDGEVDAVIDAAERPEFVQGPTSFSLFSDTFWVREDSGIKSYSDISGGRVGLVDGYNYSGSLLAYLDDLKLQREMTIDDPTNIRKLAFGRVNVIIADFASTLLFARQHRLKISPILPPFSYDPLYVSFSQDKSEIQHRFDQSFSELLKDGSIDAVYQQYLGTGYSKLMKQD